VNALRSAIIALVIVIGASGQALATTDLTGLELRIIELTNVERARHGLAPLSANAVLVAAARQHSEEMSRLGYFSHTSPTQGQRDVAERIVTAGMDDWTAVGENIAWYRGFALDLVASKVVRDWMNSPPHRANILAADFTMIGVGLSFDGHTLRATQVFAAQ